MKIVKSTKDSNLTTDFFTSKLHVDLNSLSEGFTKTVIILLHLSTLTSTLVKSKSTMRIL